MDVNSHNCPNCRELVQPRHREFRATHMQLWYVCQKCRHSFRCTASPNGCNRSVTAESPHTEKDTLLRNGLPGDVAALATLRSPCCGAGSRIKQTLTEARGVLRRHLCRSCDAQFYTLTAEEEDGGVTVTVKRPPPEHRQLDVA